MKEQDSLQVVKDIAAKSEEPLACHCQIKTLHNPHVWDGRWVCDGSGLTAQSYGRTERDCIRLAPHVAHGWWEDGKPYWCAGVEEDTADASPKSDAVDYVNHPPHYTSGAAVCATCGAGIECIDVVEVMGFNLGNSVKYIWRADLKGDAIQDLKKSMWYIQREIDRRTKTNGK